ncbi:MAG TPA: 50S ribosomal protein L35 [Candidatus Wirthbacteria bacterium]|nr:50S ribosomal protein L35 [Candidatus Wirthbacteria bacterium]
MPKLRTNKTYRKRFKVTKNGKVIRLRAGNAKLKAHKSTRTKRRYDQKVTITNPNQAKHIKKELGL